MITASDPICHQFRRPPGCYRAEILMETSDMSRNETGDVVRFHRAILGIKLSIMIIMVSKKHL